MQNNRAAETKELAALRAENEKLKAELRTASDMNAVYEGRLQEKEAENKRLRAALVVWQNAYKTGRNEPLVQAYEHSTSLSAAEIVYKNPMHSNLH